MRYQAIAIILASALAAVGCTVQPGVDVDSEDVAASADELAAAGKLLVGSYTATTVGFEQYEKLDLTADGKYEARVEAGFLEIVCNRAPCTVAESGTWTASKRA